MYIEDTVSFTKADDGGYSIHVRVKKKKSKEKSTEKDDRPVCGESSHDDKMLVAKNDQELQDIIAKIAPTMKPGGMEEDDFSKAFKEEE